VKIAKNIVADVVAEASKKMADPNYSAVLVGGFVQQQPATAQYISAHVQELGGAEAVANTVFHAALIGLCYQRANGRGVRRMSFDELNHVSDGDRRERLGQIQPHVLGYIDANIDHDEMQRVLVLIALAMDWVS
jgi:hypothetical protein